MAEQSAERAVVLAEQLGVEQKWTNKLARIGIHDATELAEWTLTDLRDVRWLGPKGVAEIVAGLARIGITLRDITRVPRERRRRVADRG